MPDDPTQTAQPPAASPAPDSSQALPVIPALPNTPMPDLGQLEHAARWADTFGGTMTNIAQRARYAQDVTDYAQALLAKQAAAQADMIAHDKGAQDLYLGSQRLDIQRQQAQAHMALEAAQTAEVGQTERRRATEAIARSNDTAGFAAHMADLIGNGVKPGSNEWQSGIATGLATYSHANPADVAKYGGQLFPGERLSPDEILARVHTITQQDPNVQVTVNPKGEATIVAKPAKAAADATAQLQDSLAASKPVYGYMNGKTFVGTKAGDANSAGPDSKDGAPQPHVQATFILPGHTKPVTQVFPRDYFDSMVAASKARQSGAVPAVDAPASPAAPSSAQSEFTDPGQVKAAFQAKRLTQDQAAAILRTQFGHQ